MKMSKILTATALIVGLLLPVATWAQAQTCPSAIPVTCNTPVQGDTTNGSNHISDYAACPNGGSFAANDAVYMLTLTGKTVLNIKLEPTGWDAAMALMPVCDNDCDMASCIGMWDSGGSGGAEEVSGVLTEGTYYILVEGYGSGASSRGPFTLTVACESCVDEDNDFSFAIDAVNCPSGNDCNDQDPAIHPGAQEICGDGIDQDCNSSDTLCDSCVGDTTAVNCTANTGTVDTATAGHANILDYCGGLGAANNTDWCGNEYIVTLSPIVDTAYSFAITNSVATDYFDIFVMPDINPDVAADTCYPNTCISTGGESFQGAPPAMFFAEGGKTYFVSVDGRKRQDGTCANGTFNYTMTCYENQACQPGASPLTLTCSSEGVAGTSADGTNNIDVYPGIRWGMPAKEKVYVFTPDAEADVTITLTMAAKDLALMVLEDEAGACLPRKILDWSDLEQSPQTTPEVVQFKAEVGKTYYVVVDGWTAADAGPFTISVACNPVCAENETVCAGVCADLQTSSENCGCCGSVCPADATNGIAACMYMYCTLICDAGFDNCDMDNSNGCETTLGTIEHCSDCNPCSLPHATPACVANACAVDQCDNGWADCDTTASNGCEADLNTDNANCGICGTVCDTGADQFCYQGGCITTCPNNLTKCTVVGIVTCVDTNTDMAHCGACDAVCALANAAESCVAGVCTLGACDATYEDCDTTAANGCEVKLGTVTNCADCGDACGAHATCTASACACSSGYADCDADVGCETQLGTVDHCSDCNPCNLPNATARCVSKVCGVQTCSAGYGNCNNDAADGCEVQLNTSNHCGTCANACDTGYACVPDGNTFSCQLSCTDADADGYEDYACGGEDCDDNNANVNPGATETCNGIDDNCDGATDEGFDKDKDGYKTCGTAIDCDDNKANIHPGATEVCGNNIDEDCSGADLKCECPDNDKDGFRDKTCGGTDCDDNNNLIKPDVEEICGDNIDNNCDGLTDDGDSCKEEDSSGCSCASSSGSVASSGLFLLMALGLAWFRRRN